jgi:hypothetical protein
MWFLVKVSSCEEGFLVVSERHLHILAARCLGRRNDYALQRDNGRYRRVGSSVTLEVLQRHVAGLDTIGAYVVNEQNTCHYAVFDADNLDGLVELLGVQCRLAADGIDSALEGSRRGGHLWVFFASALSPGLVRRWLLLYCPAGVEFYPKREWVSWDAPGSVVRVPLGVHRLSCRRYPFLVPVGAGDRVVPVAKTIESSLEWLATIRRVPVPARELLVQDDETGPATAHPFLARGVGSGTASPAETLTIHAWCDRQDSLAVLGCYLHIDRRGMACCPFGFHHDDGKDTHPSLWVHAPTVSGGRCWYCNVWKRGGNLFDFLCLWYDLAPREMWRRILAGEQF